MVFYSADFTKGRNGRNAVLVDEKGETVLKLRGSGGVLDERGKLAWYVQPSVRNLFAAAISGGQNGEPAVDLHRSRRVANGGKPTWATVEHPRIDEFVVKLHDPGTPDVTFGLLTTGEPGDPAAEGQPTANSELLVNGEVAARHWPTPGDDWRLTGSRYEVLDDTLGLPEILLLCNARYELWRPHHDPRTFQWIRQ